LYFGWNDHWLWRSHPDAGKPEPSLVDAVARRSRVVQVGLMLRDLVAPPGPSSNDRRPKSLRVPPEEFRRLLKQMIADVRAASAVPVVVTAPTDMTQDTPLADFPILEGLEQIDGGRFTTPKQLHDAYVQITREIAADAQATLVDAYQDFSGEEGLITTDHIHLTAAGVEKMAQLLAETLGAMTRE
jgi:lysophospholipase L1-like esterase